MSGGIGGRIAQTFLAQLLSTGGTVLAVLVTSRALGPEGKGVLTLALLGGRILDMAVSFGFGHALMFVRARCTWAPSRVLGAAYAFWGAVTVVLAGAGALALTSLRTDLPAGLSPAAAVLVLAMTSARLLHYLLSSILLGADQLGRYNLLNLASSMVTGLVCVGAAALHGLTVETALAAYLAGAGAAALWGAQTLGFGLDRPNGPLFRHCLGYGLQIHLGQVALFLNNRLDTLLVGAMLPVREVGLYSAAVAISEIVWRLPNVVATVLYPLVARSSDDKSAAVTAQVCRVTQGAMLVACAVLAVAIKPAVALLFGPAYSEAVWPTLLLLPGMITLSLFTLLYHDLAGRGRPGTGLAATVVGLLATLVLDLLLIPWQGIRGAAAASTVAYSLSAVWVAAGFFRATGCSPACLLWPSRADLAAGRLLLRRWRETQRG